MMIKERWLKQFDRLMDKDESSMYRVNIAWTYNDAFRKQHYRVIHTFYSLGMNLETDINEWLKDNNYNTTVSIIRPLLDRFPLIQVNRQVTTPIETEYAGDWLACTKLSKPFISTGYLNVYAEAINAIEFHYAFSKNVFYSYREDGEEEQGFDPIPFSLEKVTV